MPRTASRFSSCRSRIKQASCAPGSGWQTFGAVRDAALPVGFDPSGIQSFVMWGGGSALVTVHCVAGGAGFGEIGCSGPVFTIYRVIGKSTMNRELRTTLGCGVAK